MINSALPTARIEVLQYHNSRQRTVVGRGYLTDITGSIGHIMRVEEEIRHHRQSDKVRYLQRSASVALFLREVDRMVASGMPL